MAASSSTTAASANGLVRQLGLYSATALVVSNMIGTGIFTTTGFLAGDLGSPGLVLAIWVVGAFIALAGALCYSELGINFPSSGGEYVYLTEAFGPTWGFMVGWVSFVAGFSAPIALASLAFSDYLSYFFPALAQSQTLHYGPFSFGGAPLCAAGLIVIFSGLNCFGLQIAAVAQNLLTFLKLAVLAGFVLFATVAGKGNWDHLQQPAVRTSANSIPEQFALSLVFIYLAYSGWNAATYVAEEVRQPERTLPRALLLGTTLVAAIFLVLNLVFLYAQPLEAMKGVVAVGSLSASNLFGSDVASLFSALMAASLLATVNAMVTVGPRVYYAMAKNRAFFPAAAKVNQSTRTPIMAILMQALCAMLMCFTSFRDLLFYAGFLLNGFTVMAVIALVFVFNRRQGWRRLPAVRFAWPLIPLFYICSGAWVTFAGLRLQPTISFTALFTVVLGAFAYKIFLAPRKNSA